MLADGQNSDNAEDRSSAAVDCACQQIPVLVEIPAGLKRAVASVPGTGAALDASRIGSTHWLVRRLGDRWTLPILHALGAGPMRFARLKKTLDPISQRMLTLSLKKLERDGMIYRNEIIGVLPQVTYKLTVLGISLIKRLAILDGWLDANRRKILDANKSYSSRGGKSGRC
jgi:DNA-binding HxlR family transcriptional regulator